MQYFGIIINILNLKTFVITSGHYDFKTLMRTFVEFPDNFNEGFGEHIRLRISKNI